MTMPFAGGIDANANATLIFSLVAAVIYALTLDMRPTLARSAAKTLSVAMLAALAFMQGGQLLLVAALALSAVGDAFLSRDGEKAFLGGLASFLAAHVLYVPLFLRSHAGSTLAPCQSRPAGADRRLYRGHSGDGHLGVDARQSVGHRRHGIGRAACREKFLVPAIAPYRAGIRYAVWVLYYAAQLCITLGFLLA